MRFYFGHKEEVLDLFDQDTERMMFGKSPIIRSRIYQSRHAEKRHNQKATLRKMLHEEINARLESFKK